MYSNLHNGNRNRSQILVFSVHLHSIFWSKCSVKRWVSLALIYSTVLHRTNTSICSFLGRHTHRTLEPEGSGNTKNRNNEPQGEKSIWTVYEQIFIEYVHISHRRSQYGCRIGGRKNFDEGEKQEKKKKKKISCDYRYCNKTWQISLFHFQEHSIVSRKSDSSLREKQQNETDSG